MGNVPAAAIATIVLFALILVFFIVLVSVTGVNWYPFVGSGYAATYYSSKPWYTPYRFSRHRGW
jgi:hypothetical protein